MIHDVATELLRRREIRNSLTAWCRHCGFEPAKHHQLLIKHLQRIARGEIDRLAVFMPPGSAKSTYGSVLFPPWFMANAPGKSIIAASHTLELAEKWGRRVRGLVAGHGPTLGVSLSPESQAAGRWQLTSEGEYFAAGVGGAIVGFRADGAIIDDPVRSHEDAYSETTREKVWDWYKSELLTRLRPGGWVVLISTRWHEDDLAGRVLQEGGWEVVSLPAEAEPDDLLGRKPGEFLWDDDKSYPFGEQLREQKRALPPATWAALYQQNPLISGGNFFKTEWLKTYTTRPDPRTLKTYVTADFAVTEGAGDYTAICVFGVDSNEEIYLLDVWRKQAAPDESVDRLLDFVRDYKPLAVITESGQLKNALAPFLKKRMSERHIYAYVKTIPSRHAKDIRAQAIRGRMAVKGLYVPVQADWLSAFYREVLSFPAGKNDDLVDCLSLCGQVLDRLAPGRPLEPEKPQPKIISTDPNTCNVSLLELFEANERKYKHSCYDRIR